MDEGKAKGRLGTALALARNVPVQGNSSRGLTTNRLKATAPRQRILFPLRPSPLCTVASLFRFSERCVLVSRFSPCPRLVPRQKHRAVTIGCKCISLYQRRRCSARCIGDVSRRITGGRSSARLPREPQALLRALVAGTAACLSHENLPMKMSR